MKFFLFVVIILTINTSFSQQISIPNSFQKYKIGMPISKYLLDNPSSSKTEYWNPFSTLYSDKFVFYTTDSKTGAGDNITIDCGFYNDKLTILTIDYKDTQVGSEMLDGLKTLYGKTYQYKLKDFHDPLANADRSLEIFLWQGSSCCILEFLYLSPIGIATITYADKTMQNIFKNEKNQNILKKFK